MACNGKSYVVVIRMNAKGKLCVFVSMLLIEHNVRATFSHIVVRAVSSGQQDRHAICDKGIEHYIASISILTIFSLSSQGENWSSRCVNSNSYTTQTKPRVSTNWFACAYIHCNTHISVSSPVNAPNKRLIYVTDCYSSNVYDQEQHILPIYYKIN